MKVRCEESDPRCCAGCHELMPKRGYQHCAECGHVYRTRWHLLAVYRSERWQYSRTFPGEYGLLRLLFGGPWRPSKINFCQCCIHDF